MDVSDTSYGGFDIWIGSNDWHAYHVVLIWVQVGHNTLYAGPGDLAKMFIYVGHKATISVITISSSALSH